MTVLEKCLFLGVRFLLFFLVGVIGTLLPLVDVTFPYVDKLVASGLPRWLYSWGNFDGVHYIGIALQGYHEFDQAFFPVFPMLIRALEVFMGSYVLSGLLLSHVFLCGGTLLLYKLCEQAWGEQSATWIIMWTLAVPCAFFFGAIYNESLFLLLIVSCLYALAHKKLLLASMLGVIAGLTRVQGVLLIFPFMIMLYPIGMSWKDGIVHTIQKYIFVIISPLLGLLGYMVYLAYSMHDWLYFLHAQSAFGAHRTSQLITLPQVYVRYVRIFMTADYSWAYAIALLEFASVTIGLMCSLWLIRYAYINRDKLAGAIAVLSLALLIMPTLTGTFSSLPRYSITALAIPLACSMIPSKRIKIGLMTLSILLQIFLACAFIQGRFVA